MPLITCVVVNMKCGVFQRSDRIFSIKHNGRVKLSRSMKIVPFAKLTRLAEQVNFVIAGILISSVPLGGVLKRAKAVPVISQTTALAN